MTLAALFATNSDGDPFFLFITTAITFIMILFPLESFILYKVLKKLNFKIKHFEVLIPALMTSILVVVLSTIFAMLIAPESVLGSFGGLENLNEANYLQNVPFYRVIFNALITFSALLISFFVIKLYFNKNKDESFKAAAWWTGIDLLIGLAGGSLLLLLFS